jgi:uncharacterized protein (DUF1501 family)
MCENQHRGRFGERLSHGPEHAADHERWTRRQFVSALGLGGAGAFIGGALPIRAALSAPVLHPLASAGSDRILVLVQLEGGNDGLNTVIPVEDDRYYRNRPILAIPKASALDVGEAYRLHPALRPLLPEIGGGRVQIIHGVGYENPDLSHFRSTDIWVSGSDADENVRTGWIARSIEAQWPEMIQNPPTTPLAVQIGGAATMFRGDQTNVGASFRDAEQLEQLTRGGAFYDPALVPDTRFGRLMTFTREVANRSYRYASALENAASAGENRVSYPGGSLSEQLALVAKLIKGDLGARVYHVSLSGFDTHSIQEAAHPALLAELAGAAAAFMADLDVAGRRQQVLMMTFSEFGRTVSENGSRGTDHATVAPLFLLGEGLAGPSFGVLPDLDVVNQFGDLQHIVDFRTIYATILQEWLLIPPEVVDQALGRRFDRLDLFSSVVAREPQTPPDGFLIGEVYPNPASRAARLPVRFRKPTRVAWGVFDALGRQVYQGNQAVFSAGEDALVIPTEHLAPGRYFLRISVGGRAETRSLVVIRS